MSEAVTSAPVDDITVETSGQPAPVVETPASAVASVEATSEADDAPQADPADPVAPETPKAKPNSIQARIDKAVAAQREAERRAAAAERQLQELARPRTEPARSEPTTPKAPQYLTGAPPSEDEIGTTYQDYPDFIRATARWQVAEARAADALEARHRATYERHEATSQQFAERIAKAEQADPDYWSKIDPAVANLKPSTALQPGERPSALNAIADMIFDSDHATELMARLRAADLQRLSTLPPAQLYREMGRFEASVMHPAAAVTGPAPKVPPISQAPPPIKPVGTSASASEVDPLTDDLDMDEHIRVMNARDKKTGRFARR